MFLAPSSSRAVDPYLQTLLPMVSLSRLGGKHRQVARQVGGSASSLANSMGGSSDANNVPEGTTLVFGSWSCMADGSGGFSSHLITPKASESKMKVVPSGTPLALLGPTIEFVGELTESPTWRASCRCLPPSLLRDTLSSRVCR